MSGSSIPRALRRQVETRDAGRCGFCGLRQWGQAATFHVDHIVPRSKGVPTSLDNLVSPCPHCNLCKSNKLAADDPLAGGSVRLFHPLSDRWDEHLESDEAGQCHSRTAIGRATIEALAMNDALARRARYLQRKLGIL